MEAAGGADYVVLGEGENRLPKLIGYLERGEKPQGVDGIAAKNGVNRRKDIYTTDLDSQPFAAVDLLPLENYWKLGYSHGPFAGKYMNILTSRGCPYTCSFCQAPAMCGGRWNAKSAERVLEEIQYHIDEYGVKDFHIQDENFAISRKRVEDICVGLLEGNYGITFCFPSGLKMETGQRPSRPSDKSGLQILLPLSRNGLREGPSAHGKNSKHSKGA